MKTKLLAVLLWGGALLLIAAPVFAHHAEVVYDTTKLINLSGTVTKFELINPHGVINFQVKDDQGNVEDWIVELGPPQMYIRSGWNKNTIKPGDQISISSHPHKEGLSRVRYEKLEINGKPLRAGGGAGAVDGAGGYN